MLAENLMDHIFKPQAGKFDGASSKLAGGSQ